MCRAFNDAVISSLLLGYIVTLRAMPPEDSVLWRRTLLKIVVNLLNLTSTWCSLLYLCSRGYFHLEHGILGIIVERRRSSSGLCVPLWQTLRTFSLAYTEEICHQAPRIVLQYIPAPSWGIGFMSKACDDSICNENGPVWWGSNADTITTYVPTRCRVRQNLGYSKWYYSPLIFFAMRAEP